MGASFVKVLAAFKKFTGKAQTLHYDRFADIKSINYLDYSFIYNLYCDPDGPPFLLSVPSPHFAIGKGGDYKGKACAPFKSSLRMIWRWIWLVPAPNSIPLMSR